MSDLIQRTDKAIVAGVTITTVLMLSIAFMQIDGNNVLATKYEKSQANKDFIKKQETPHTRLMIIR
jgi:hypothetical protein